jgi:hypothetical protein
MAMKSAVPDKEMYELRRNVNDTEWNKEKE